MDLKVQANFKRSTQNNKFIFVISAVYYELP